VVITILRGSGCLPSWTQICRSTCGGAEGEVVAAHALDHRLADHEAVGHAVHQDVIGVLVEQVAGRRDDVELRAREIEHGLQRVGRGHLGDAPGEARLRLGADGLDDRRAEVDADVGGLVGGEDAGLGVLDAALGDLLAVDEQRAVPPLPGPPPS
jgi:hypothetical protein